MILPFSDTPTADPAPYEVQQPEQSKALVQETVAHIIATTTGKKLRYPPGLEKEGKPSVHVSISALTGAIDVDSRAFANWLCEAAIFASEVPHHTPDGAARWQVIAHNVWDWLRTVTDASLALTTVGTNHVPPEVVTGILLNVEQVWRLCLKWAQEQTGLYVYLHTAEGESGVPDRFFRFQWNHRCQIRALQQPGFRLLILFAEPLPMP